MKEDKEGNLLILDGNFKGVGEAIREVKTVIGDCERCGKVVTIKSEMEDIIIGV
jgi:hypothetical protein